MPLYMFHFFIFLPNLASASYLRKQQRLQRQQKQGQQQRITEGCRRNEIVRHHMEVESTRCISLITRSQL